MAFISVPENLPGIHGPLAFRPEVAEGMRGFTQVLMRGPSSLSVAERELIAAYVSRLNGCSFCYQSHASTARYLFGADAAVVDAVIADLESAPVDERMRALLCIAATVQRDARCVTQEDADAARAAGADDVAIHDTVLVAAAFCMFNKYVDGLGTDAPDDPAVYAATAAERAGRGYRPG
ncbi:MAG TPA: peroxidase-related enzyme [Candidatus Kapabacteria bacterium]|nr:peroxidase-related enzyme [Candidatus Kapabacteria bacterium]